MIEYLLIGISIGIGLWFIPCLLVLYKIASSIKSVGARMNSLVTNFVPLLGAIAPMLGMVLPGMGDVFKGKPPQTGSL